MKITNVEAIILKQPCIDMVGDGSQDTVLVVVETDAGITGYGEIDSSPYVMREIIQTPASHMACMGLREVLLGENPLDYERLWKKMYDKSIYYGRRSAAIHAMSGIDIAIWDIMGKYYNVPISTLLGGRFRESIKAYCSVLMPETEAEIARLVEQHMPKGYTGMKLGWGALGQSHEKDVALIKAARRLLGDDKYLMADIGMVWNDRKTALRTCREFSEQNVFWVEEPFGPDDLESYHWLKERTDLRISGGEEVGTLYEYKELIEKGCVDIVQPDLSRCGGFTVAKKLTDLAGLHSVSIVPHAFKTGILLAATLQYIAALPQALFVEYCEQDTILRKTLTQNQILPKNGIVDIPNLPGLGIEIDMDVVKKHRV